VMMPAAMVHTVGEPIERKQHPRTADEEKFSVPYIFASALVGGAALRLAFPTPRMPWSRSHAAECS
jgi:2-methylcitrate dehydratase PrpD